MTSVRLLLFTSRILGAHIAEFLVGHDSEEESRVSRKHRETDKNRPVFEKRKCWKLKKTKHKSWEMRRMKLKIDALLAEGNVQNSVSL